tara:strand:- start:2621 stop:3547 length:927 start_codon:yes stop_codon:yes gene_type:complete
VPLNNDALTVSGLSHNYGERRALSNVSFTVEQGTQFALLGPNGSGKTTLFRIISTLLPTIPEKVHIFGNDVTLSSSEIRRLIGVVFQSPSLDQQLTVRENLLCHGHLYRLRGKDLGSRVDQALDLVDLRNRSDDRVHTLSGGLQRRVELAKAWLPNPPVLILDEPSTGLDPGARRDFWSHIGRLRSEKGTSIILTTHLMDEATMADRVCILNHGTIVALGSPEDLVAEIGGEVLLIYARNLSLLAEAIRKAFNQEVAILNNCLRIERPEAHAFISDLVDKFSEEIESVTFGKPTLEDVFLHHTGKPWI